MAGSGKRREVAFGEQLARLFVQAGRPTLRAASSGTASSGSLVSSQRISDWRNGRHLPHEFSTVEPLLVWLIDRAVRAGEKDVLSIPQWKKLWASDEPTRIDEPADDAEEQTVRPFAGLASLTAADRAVYFGRDELIADLADTITAAAHDIEPRVVIVAGVSGSGKSSLLGAGLARAEGLPPGVRARIDSDGLHLDELTDSTQLLIIDQFENVFTLDDDAVGSVIGEIESLAQRMVVVIGVRADFFGHCVEFPMLARAWQRRCVIVTEMTDAQIRSAITGPVKLAGGRIESGLADVMISDLHAAAGVGDRAGRLPLLAHVLQVTWARRSGNRMTVSAYRASGGIARAVADTAEAAWASVDLTDQDLARTLLMAMVHVSPSGVPLRTSLPASAIGKRFPDGASAIVDIFAQARLITVTAESVMLIHDVVLTAWPRLKGWIAADLETHLWRQQLDIDTVAWDGTGRQKSFLYTGSRLEHSLEQREEMSAHYRHLLSSENEEFLDSAVAARRVRRRLRLSGIAVVAVLAVISMIAAAIGFRQAHDLTTQRNAAERTALLSQIDSLRTSNPSLAARLLLAADVLHPDDAAVTERILGAATTPLAQSLPGHSGPVYGIAYSANGELMASASGDRTVRLWRSTGPDSSGPDSIGLNSSGAEGLPYRTAATLDGFDNFVTSVDFHPTQPLLAASGGDGTVRVWDITAPATPRPVVTLRPGNGRTVYMARFSPDGSHLSASADDGSISFYRVLGGPNPINPAPIATIDAHEAAGRTLSYRPDGKLLASGGDDQVVWLWDVSDPAAPVPAGPALRGFPSITHAVEFSPDGRNLAVTGDSANAQIWDVADPGRPHPMAQALPNTTGGSWSITYSPDGRRLASARSDGAVAVWNTVDPAEPLGIWSLQNTPVGGVARTFSAAFDPGGTRLTVGRQDGSIDVWHLPDTVSTGQGGTVTSLATSLDADKIVTTGADTMLTVWTPDDAEVTRRGRIPVQRRVNDQPRVAMDQAGNTAATANNNGGLVQLWNVSDPDRPSAFAEIPIGTRYTNPLAFSPRGDRLAVGASDTEVALWDLADPSSPRQIRTPLVGATDLIRNVAFDADGDVLAVSSDDTNVYLYDLTSDSAEPIAVVAADSAGPQVAFTDDGTLVVGGAHLTAWQIRGAQTVELARVDDVYVANLSITPHRVVVATSNHQLRTFALGDGEWSEEPRVTPLMTSADSSSTWVLPTRSSTDDVIWLSGDGTGSLYRQSARPDDALAWICAATSPLDEEDVAELLPRRPGEDRCSGVG